MMQILERLHHRLSMMIGRGRLQTGNDSGNVQLLQVRFNADEVYDNQPRLAEYGFTSMPPTDADAVVIFVGGERSNGVIIATGHQASRLKGLKPGEAALYDNLGQSIYLTRTGIVIDGAGLPITITNAPNISLDTSGNLSVSGNIADSTGKTLAGARAVYNGHTHSDPQGGTTGTPGASM